MTGFFVPKLNAVPINRSYVQGLWRDMPLMTAALDCPIDEHTANLIGSELVLVLTEANNPRPICWGRQVEKPEGLSLSDYLAPILMMSVYAYSFYK